MLDGLDDIDWASLGSATGTADELPAMLRAIAAGAEPEAGNAVGDLVNEVFHQGTVWDCTEPAIPFVVELVLDPSVPHRSSLVYLLGSLLYEGVDSVDPHVPRLMSLLDDPDDDVRECAAYLVGWHDGPPELTLPVLLRRWDEEPVPLVRASVLAAIGTTDRDRGRALAEGALGDPDPVLRAAGGLVLVQMRELWSPDEVPLPAGVLEAVASAFAGGDPLDGWVWSSNAQSEFLSGIEDVPGARDIMLASLAGGPSADTRQHTVFEIEDRIRTSRSAPARLVPVLGPLLSDEDTAVRKAAARAVRRAGSSGRLVGDAVAELAGTLPSSDTPPDGAEPALATLIELGDPRGRSVLLAAWQRPRVLPEAAQALNLAAPEADPELVAAVASRIAAQADAAATGTGRIGAEVDALAALVTRWPADGSPAASGLIAALEHEVATDRPTPGRICEALAHLGPPASPALPALRTAAARGFHGHDRIDAALAIWRLAGDPGPALEVGTVLLSGPNGYDESHQAWLYPESVVRLLPLGSHLVPLEPHIRRHIADHPERHTPNCALARVLWHLHGDAAEVLPILRAGLSFTRFGKPDPVGGAIRAAGELGEQATPLLDLLRDALRAETGWVAAMAAATLLRLGAGDPAELVAVLVPEPAAGRPWYASSAASAVDAVAELSLARAAPRLRAWLDTDERVRAHDDDTVRLDERFQARTREVLAALA